MRPKTLKIDATLDTPSVHFDADAQKIEISGKSFPADVALFYKPVLKWIEEYMLSPNNETTLDLKLDYFNTASSKILLDILYKFEELKRSGKSAVIVRWHYPDDDEDMQETGTEYAAIVAVPFEHVSYSVVLK